MLNSTIMRTRLSSALFSQVYSPFLISRSSSSQEKIKPNSIHTAKKVMIEWGKWYSFRHARLVRIIRGIQVRLAQVVIVDGEIIREAEELAQKGMLSVFVGLDCAVTRYRKTQTEQIKIIVFFLQKRSTTFNKHCPLESSICLKPEAAALD